MPLLPLLVLLSGCAPDERPALFQGCGSLDCEVERAVSAWPQGASEVTAAIAAHPVMEARVAAVSALVERYPGQTADLCAALPAGPSQERCQQLQARPHLWEPARQEVPHQARPGGGPASNEIAPAQALPAALLDQPPSADHGCPEGAADRVACLSEAAQEQARRRQASSAAAVCRNIESERWRGECLFQAAEAAVQADPTHGYGAAVELCAAAVPFVQNCHSHTLIILGDLAPAATDTRPHAWQALRQAAEAVEMAWKWRDPYMAEVATDRLWSDGLGRAYTGVQEITGDPLDHLPEPAHRHVRAAVARAVVEQQGAASHDLAGHVQQAQQALARRVEAPRTGRRQEPFRTAPELWPVDLPDEEARPATFFLGTARRTWAEDEAVDLAICVLEAAARMPPLPEALLAEAAQHPDERVRWTAARLRELREPQAP